MHFDNEKDWVENSTAGYKVFLVTVHELGHALGLKHYMSKKEIMYPAYVEKQEWDLDLGIIDKREIRRRYGSKECTDKIWKTYYLKRFPDKWYKCKDSGEIDCNRYSYKDALYNKDMSKHCARHFGFCGPCWDNYLDRCKEQEVCMYNVASYVSMCQNYCGYCIRKDKEVKDKACRNLLPECKNYSYKECKTNSVFMKNNCPRHCGFCGPCTDNFEHCSNIFKGNGKCNERFAPHLEGCAGSCGFCAQRDKEIMRKLGNLVQNESSIVMDNINQNNDNKEVICKANHLDGVFRTGEGMLYIILDGYLYRKIDIQGQVDPDYKLKLSDAGIDKPTAATFDQNVNQLYLFQEGKLLLVSKFNEPLLRLSTEYQLPKEIENPQGAFIRNGSVHVIQKRNVFTIHIVDKAVKIKRTQSIDDIFQSGKFAITFPNVNIDGTLQHGKTLSFFVGSSVLECTIGENGKYTIPAAGIKPFMTTEMHCPQTD